MNRENHTPPARTAPPESTEKQFVHCKCGDSHPANSYGAGFIDANGGVCENCDMYEPRISISAKLGKEWVKAYMAFDEAKKSLKLNGSSAPFYEALRRFEEASDMLGAELIANGHHEAEGD